ncbi:uncharacterized protein OCT59_021055 [Rhizophagus irregularis]|uniref:uncharacterized protein n=1 Tax=Rhizophagus irregularis TaxID=588596 RepID=UPI003319AE34|nr:hypothetical protein OCT59_021055 [Rhizophagus irregularis]
MNNIMILLLKLVWLFLHYRSPYLRRILSTNEKKNDGTLAHIKLSNISSNNFKVYLWWKLSLIDYDNSDVIKVLVAASELSLHELVLYLQFFLIKNKENCMENNFNFVYQISLKMIHSQNFKNIVLV